MQGVVCWLSATPSVATGVPLPGLLWVQGMDDGLEADSLRDPPEADFGGRGTGARGHAEVAANLVPGDVVRDQPEA